MEDQGGPRRATYENPGHHDPSSPEYVKGKEPLPKDAESVFANAIKDTERATGTSETYYGRAANGQYFRYQGVGGKVHWNGTVKREYVPNWIRKQLETTGDKQ